MRSFDIALPSAPGTVEIAETPALPALSDEAFAAGHDAGYKAGQRLAAVEAAKAEELRKREIARVLASMSVLSEKYLDTATGHLGELLLLALDRIFVSNPYTAEDVAKEVGGLITEVRQSAKIRIECHPEDMTALQSAMDSSGASLVRDSRIEWVENPSLAAGEYLLESDLGTVDGRKLTRAAKVRTALGELAVLP